MKKITTIALIWIAMIAQAQSSLPWLKISSNRRFFQTADGKPFFWLGDTGWLLFVKCNREEAIQYLETRKQQGFNVVQAILLHELNLARNVYGDSALINMDPSKPNTTTGKDFKKEDEYDYWDHVEFIINEAAKRGLYIALVPVWGSNVKDGLVNTNQAKLYAEFLAKRFSDKSNVIWLNGGDIKGNDGLEVWKTIGTTLRNHDKKHLISYHPRGRNSSSEWFHHERWLDFNMVQSGHRNYEQDTSRTEKYHYGEDNWKYIRDDYSKTPVKPVLDGEPSYENIPQGLHDSAMQRWTASDVRRYAYWSVFAGGAGFTYGENSIMQFHTIGDKDANYGVNKNWKETLHAPGAEQMRYLKKLILSKSYFDRTPAQEIIADNTQDKYNYILAAKGQHYAMIYTYTGRNFKVDFSKLKFKILKASWFNPSNGKTERIKNIAAKKIVEFDPPGEPSNGNDWVLVLE